MAKMDQMMQILWMLSSGRKATAKQMAEKLEVNIRTVYRYIDALCGSGVPIIAEAGHHGGYTLLHQFVESPLLFSTEEQTALLQAAALAKEAGYFSGELLDRAASKLSMYSTPEQESMVRRRVEGLDVIGSAAGLPEGAILRELEHGVINQVSMEIDYYTVREDQPKRRKIDPYGIIYWNGRWYVAAFCHLRNEIRSFRVDRIAGMAEIGTSFNRPADFSASGFFMKNLLPEKEQTQEFVPFVISGRTGALDDLCRHWFLGHHLAERTSERAVFILEKEALHTYVAHLLLPYGKSLKVLEPDSMKKKLVEVLYELADHYQK
ncbi:helix-turn-helix transcriptional regulator [Bacillus infantis]|uniref:helix-turn-helix transcriptional regulator n=1 Tax=Bacillus infantis TaxID=324767 RepID=UPI0020A0E0DF|nr:YafY family protein [Bacillus infantis]MCP1157067.1 YafY family transcriptional regulator [Bacillus infantis]